MYLFKKYVRTFKSKKKYFKQFKQMKKTLCKETDSKLLKTHLTSMMDNHGFDHTFQVVQNTIDGFFDETHKLSIPVLNDDRMEEIIYEFHKGYLSKGEDPLWTDRENEPYLSEMTSTNDYPDGGYALLKASTTKSLDLICEYLTLGITKINTKLKIRKIILDFHDEELTAKQIWYLMRLFKVDVFTEIRINSDVGIAEGHRRTVENFFIITRFDEIELEHPKLNYSRIIENIQLSHLENHRQYISIRIPKSTSEPFGKCIDFFGKNVVLHFTASVTGYDVVKEVINQAKKKIDAYFNNYSFTTEKKEALEKLDALNGKYKHYDPSNMSKSEKKEYGESKQLLYPVTLAVKCSTTFFPKKSIHFPNGSLVDLGIRIEIY